MRVTHFNLIMNIGYDKTIYLRSTLYVIRKNVRVKYKIKEGREKEREKGKSIYDQDFQSNSLMDTSQSLST